MQDSGQQVNVLDQIQSLTDFAKRHDDEIDDLRGMSEFMHEIAIQRAQRERVQSGHQIMAT